jgi:hypothetical protein
MNKRNRDQLRASIAKDLTQGQGPPSPTRELLKHYSPLEGIVTAPETDISLRSAPVENTLVPDATVAQGASSAWHGATVARHATLAPHATVERCAIVKGELRVPNTLNFSLFSTLDPFVRAVYYQLFLLSHGVPERHLSGQLGEAGEISSDVPAKGPEHNCLSRKARID